MEKYEKVISWWKNKNIHNASDLALVLDNFRIVFACNSNSIEGNTMTYPTTREVFEGKQLTNFSGTAREIFEAQNQKFAFEFLLKEYDNKTKIDIQFIQKMHSLLMYGCYDSDRWAKNERPGEFKKHDYCIGISELGAPPNEVETELQDLLNELNDNANSSDVLLKAAYFHAVFETIHPFADGNGRIGRALMNYYLLLEDYPPIVLFSEDKETYYLALEVFDRSGKLDGFVKFLQEQLVKTWGSKIEKISRKLDCF